MDLPKEILVIIFDIICKCKIDVFTNRLLDHLADEEWQIELMKKYETLSLVCLHWDKIMCEEVSLPYHKVRMSHGTRYRNVQCVRPIFTDMVPYSVNEKTKCVVFHQDTSVSEFYDDIAGKGIKIIGFRNYKQLIEEYQQEEKNYDINDPYYKSVTLIDCRLYVMGFRTNTPKWVEKYLPTSYDSLMKLSRLIFSIDPKNSLCQYIFVKILLTPEGIKKDVGTSFREMFQTIDNSLLQDPIL